MDSSQPLQNWIPVRLRKAEEEPVCEWIYVGNKRFTEPFFDDTIRACWYDNTAHRPYKVLSDLHMMREWSSLLPTIPVTAIIFHVSRCGSTLLSQLLAADEKNCVLSEIPFLDEMLRLPFQSKGITESRGNDDFKQAVSFYGQRRIDGQERLFIKTDCWHLHFYKQLRSIFPGVPFFLLYREPHAVLRSQQQQRGIQSVPGLIEPSIFGFTREQSSDTNLDRYMANVLATFYSKIIQVVQEDPLAFPLDFSWGMHNNVKNLYKLLDLPLDPSLASLFEERCRFHGKRPLQAFTDDPVVAEIPAFAKHVMFLYEQLSHLVETSHSVHQIHSEKAPD